MHSLYYFAEDPIQRNPLIRVFTAIFALCAGLVAHARVTLFAMICHISAAASISLESISLDKYTKRRVPVVNGCWLDVLRCQWYLEWEPTRPVGLPLPVRRARSCCHPPPGEPGSGS